jgi:hypothetical protein
MKFNHQLAYYKLFLYIWTQPFANLSLVGTNPIDGKVQRINAIFYSKIKAVGGS